MVNKRKNIFIISSVRGQPKEYQEKLESYVAHLEKRHDVHLPHRDTNQKANGIDICFQNSLAIKDADEVHIFYSSASQGTHFDMGMAFALRKPLVVVENEEYGEGKSFPRMLDEWSSHWK